MANMPLVSVIVPCYNGELHVHRLLDSILIQDYENIEFIFINDGSTDNTESIVLSYRSLLEKKRISFKYISQENVGKGAALNNGLKLFTGDYLCFADADDYFAQNSVSRKLEYLETNKSFGAVSSDAYMLDETDLNNPICKVGDTIPFKYEVNQFLHLIKKQSIFWTGCHMFRSTAFLDVHPRRKIYPSRRGQNWQLLLPMDYKYKRGYIDEPLYNIIIRKGSLSRSDDTFEKKYLSEIVYEDVINKTIDSIDMPENEKLYYSLMVKKIYIRKKMVIAYKYKNEKIFYEQFRLLNEQGWANLNDYRILLRMKYKSIDYLHIILAPIVRKLTKLMKLL